MTRVVIAYEGKPTVNPGFYLKPGAMKWDDEPIPIVHAFDITRPMGYARDPRREDDGAITVEIGEVEINEAEACSCTATGLITNRDELHTVDQWDIFSCRLREVSVIPKENFPWEV